MITKKEIIKILFTLLLLIGATSGIVLTQQSQDIREKAEMICDSGNRGLCGIGAGCPKGYMCNQERCIKHSACDYPYCPATDCNLPKSLPEAIYCIMSTSGRLTTCCPTDKPLYQDGKCIQAQGSGGGGGGGGTQAGCSSASAAKCQGKNPGDSCGSGKKCIALNQSGSDGKPKCTCTTSSGGGGENSCDKNPNPTVLDIKNDGEVLLSFASFLESTPPKIALKKNSQTCSLTEYDKLIDTKDTKTDQVIVTGVQVKNGDKLCIYGEDVGSDSGPYPFEGWIKPENNKCKEKDVSSLIKTTQSSGGIIISQQCWGDYAKKAECDFNDYALIIAVSPKSSPTENIKILFRQQGITTKIKSNIPSQLDTYITLTNEEKTHKIGQAPVSVDENGIWTINFSTDEQGNNIPAGTYNLYIKGVSHLRKKFANVQISNNNTIIDKSTDIKDELKAGDANNDNIISIEDISLVLKYYTDFKIKVNASDKNMIGADITKDGYITIDDLALVALNWSSFIIKGD